MISSFWIVRKLARFAGAFFASFLALSVSTASAQNNQTPEGAQQFIAIIAANGSTSTRIPLYAGGMNAVRDSEQQYSRSCSTDFWGGRTCKSVTAGRRYFTRTLDPIAVVGSGSTDVCVTTFTIVPPYSEEPKIPPTFTVDWKRVTKVQPNAEWVNLSGQQVEFRLSSSDLATRVAYAMEFLRQHCDPAAATGF